MGCLLLLGKTRVAFALCWHIHVPLTFKMCVVCFYEASVYAVGAPVNVNTTQCIILGQHPPTRYKIPLHLNHQLSSLIHSLHLKLQWYRSVI